MPCVRLGSYVRFERVAVVAWLEACREPVVRSACELDTDERRGEDDASKPEPASERHAPRGNGKSRLLGRLALGGVRSGSRVGDALRLPGLEDDHLAAAVDGRCLGDVRNPDEPDCCAGEPDDEREERKGGDGSARRLLINGRECGFADNRNMGLEDDLGSDDVVRPVVGRMSARGHTKYVGSIGVRVVPCSSDAASPPPHEPASTRNIRRTGTGERLRLMPSRPLRDPRHQRLGGTGSPSTMGSSEDGAGTGLAPFLYFSTRSVGSVPVVIRSGAGRCRRGRLTTPSRDADPAKPTLRGPGRACVGSLAVVQGPEDPVTVELCHCEEPGVVVGRSGMESEHGFDLSCCLPKPHDALSSHRKRAATPALNGTAHRTAESAGTRPLPGEGGAPCCGASPPGLRH